MNKKKIKTLDIIFIVLLIISLLIQFITLFINIDYAILIGLEIACGIIGILALLYLFIFRC